MLQPLRAGGRVGFPVSFRRMRAVSDKRVPEPYRRWIAEAALPPNVVFLPATGPSARMGVFMGPEGVLVRMGGDRCHPIPRDRYLGARLFQPPGTMSTAKQILILETADGRIEMPAAALSAHPDALNQTARSLWPQWAGVGSFVRDDRERLSDPRTVKARRWLAVSIGAVVLTMVADLMAGPGNLSPAFGGIAVLVYMILMALLAVRTVASRLGSPCPRCGGETGRVVEALPYRHWYCRRCNVEWDDEARKAAKSGATWQV